MKVLVAGGSGVIGRHLVPVLKQRGHHVVGLSRTEPADSAGADSWLAVDVLAEDDLHGHLVRVEADAVVNVLSAIPERIDPRRMRRDFARTNELRSTGTARLLDAAVRTGTRIVVSESLAYPYAAGQGPASEDVGLASDVPAQFRDNLAAIRALEAATASVGGTSLRVGHLYGPGTHYARDGAVTRDVRRGAMPIVGDGGATYSFVHAHDAAVAFADAVENPVGGVLNVVDDDPTLLREWLPELAAVLHAPAPRHVPRWVARIVAGSWGLAYMTSLRGADNRRLRAELGWEPEFASWREGLRQSLQD